MNRAENIIYKLDMIAVGEAFNNIGIMRAEATYSGSGDSGCIDDIKFINKKHETIPEVITKIQVKLPYSEEILNAITNIYRSSYRSAVFAGDDPGVNKNELSDFEEQVQKALDPAYKGDFEPLFNLDAYSKREVPLPDLITNLCYAELESRVGGWENNEGGEGTFNIYFESNSKSNKDGDFGTLYIELIHKQFYTDFELSQYDSEFEISNLSKVVD